MLNVSKRCFQPLPRAFEKVTFDATKHLVPYSQGSLNVSDIQVNSLSSLGYQPIYTEDEVIDFGYTQPFKLLTHDCVEIIRNELLTQGVMDNCYYSSNVAPLVIRGPTQHSPFLRQLFNCPEMTEILNAVTQTKVRVHPMEYEHAHCNIQVPRKKQNNANKAFDWHFDSQDFVLIIMLSDVPADAEGGGTLVEAFDADGNVVQHELMFNEKGTAYFMNGSRIRHAGNNAQNYMRATCITSYLYDDLKKVDQTDVKLAAKYTDHKELGDEYLNYRLSDLMKKAEFFKNKTGDSKMFLKQLQQHLDITVDSMNMMDNIDKPKKLNLEEIDVSFAQEWQKAMAM